jgi:hypothetical protein
LSSMPCWRCPDNRKYHRISDWVGTPWPGAARAGVTIIHGLRGRGTQSSVSPSPAPRGPTPAPRRRLAGRPADRRRADRSIKSATIRHITATGCPPSMHLPEK